MPNLSDDNRPTQEITVITDETIRYTNMDAAVAAVIEAYRASIDTRSNFDVPWPVNSEVVALVIEAPTKGWRVMLLRFKIARALERHMPVKSVEITAERIKVLADKTSDRAPSSFSPQIRRHG